MNNSQNSYQRNITTKSIYEKLPFKENREILRINNGIILLKENGGNGIRTIVHYHSQQATFSISYNQEDSTLPFSKNLWNDSYISNESVHG